MLIDVDALADEVSELCRRIDTAEARHGDTYHATSANDRQRLREIGELANQHGGTDLMLQIVYVASWSYRNTVHTINSPWQEIGGWQRQ